MSKCRPSDTFSDIIAVFILLEIRIWPAICSHGYCHKNHRLLGTNSAWERHARAQHSAVTVCTHLRGRSYYEVSRRREVCRAVLSVTYRTGAPPESDTPLRPEQSCFHRAHDGQLNSVLHYLNKHSFLQPVWMILQVFLYFLGEPRAHETQEESPVTNAIGSMHSEGWSGPDSSSLRQPRLNCSNITNTSCIHISCK